MFLIADCIWALLGEAGNSIKPEPKRFVGPIRTPSVEAQRVSAVIAHPIMAAGCAMKDFDTLTESVSNRERMPENRIRKALPPLEANWQVGGGKFIADAICSLNDEEKEKYTITHDKPSRYRIAATVLMWGNNGYNAQHAIGSCGDGHALPPLQLHSV